MKRKRKNKHKIYTGSATTHAYIQSPWWARSCSTPPLASLTTMRGLSRARPSSRGVPTLAQCHSISRIMTWNEATIFWRNFSKPLRTFGEGFQIVALASLPFSFFGFEFNLIWFGILIWIWDLICDLVRILYDMFIILEN